MVTSVHDPSIEIDFPAAAADGYILTSAETPDYNCVAWANGLDDVNMWPTFDEIPGNYWPAGAPKEQTLEAFVAAFKLEGWDDAGQDGAVEPDYEKVAIYLKNSEVTHMARQLPDGTWTSKLGPNKDISHSTLAALASSAAGPSLYGDVVRFLRRKRGRSGG
jgi:hypothetical protein